MRSRSPLVALYAGAFLALVALAVPFVDRAQGNVLAAHIRAVYPDYSDSRIDSAVTAYLVILTIVGVLGLASWAGSIWAVSTRKRWAPLLVSSMFVIGLCVAASGLLIKDTSGEVGLAPLLGWITMLPCLAGAAAVFLVWRRTPARAAY